MLQRKFEILVSKVGEMRDVTSQLHDRTDQIERLFEKDIELWKSRFDAQN